MSLKVWLPLNGDLRNLGSSDLQFSIINNSTTTINNDGKIGKCYSNNSKTSGGLISDKIIDLTQTQSMFCWFKFTDLTSSSNLGAGLVSQHRYPNCTGMGITIKYVSSTTGYLSVNTGTGSSRTFNQYCGTTLLQANTWYHGGYTYDGSNIKIYVNGACELTHPFTGMSVPAEYITCYCWSMGSSSGTDTYGYYKLNGYMNDIRIYDHCLSALEVKELSYGLVCHYKFDNMYNMNNLILNGNGELGTKHWNSGSMTTAQVPPNQPIIKGSFYSNNTTDFIEINKYNTYTLNSYIKATSTSGTFYPSIFPYDVDKKQIMTYNCSEGFSNTYKTTLAQPLKKGDTVIYATDLSAWTTGDNYYFHVAIFGYRDSKGFIYPDMQYTADSPTFGTKTDKSKIDKTNNTITLNAAFTGEDRPVGTTICQATEGSTYYYPFGGLASTSVQDWTLKTANIVPKNVPKLVWAKYIRWNAYSGGYYAGNKLMDMTWWDNYIKDDSGNGYNLEVVNNLLADSDTPRYSYSTRFPLNTSYCRVTFPSVSGFANSYTFSWWGKSVSSGTMMWGFSNGNRLNLYLVNPVCWNTGDGSNNPFAGISPITDNKFHYYTITGDGTTTKLYIDGEFKANAKTYKGITGTTLYFNGWDTSTSYKFCGCLSDFKLFATVLSETDIKRIYEEALSVGKLGDMHPYEVKEDTTNGINKDGVFSNQVFSENYLTEVSKYDNNLYIEPDGAVFIRISHQARPDTKIFSSSNDFVNGVYLDSDRWACLNIMNDCSSWEFMIKQKPESTSAEQIYRWTQQVNPITGTYEDVVPANVIFNSNSRYIVGAFKGGVYKLNSNAFLVQNSGVKGNWWGAICAWARHNNGLPGFGSSSNVVKTGYLDLYIRIDNQFKLGDGVFKKYKHNNTWYSPCIIER